MATKEPFSAGRWEGGQLSSELTGLAPSPPPSTLLRPTRRRLPSVAPLAMVPSSLKVTELKSELIQRRVSFKSNAKKAELVAALEGALAAEAATAKAEDKGEGNSKGTSKKRKERDGDETENAKGKFILQRAGIDVRGEWRAHPSSLSPGRFPSHLPRLLPPH